MAGGRDSLHRHRRHLGDGLIARTDERTALTRMLKNIDEFTRVCLTNDVRRSNIAD
jgi:hypothetical protein